MATTMSTGLQLTFRSFTFNFSFEKTWTTPTGHFHTSTISKMERKMVTFVQLLNQHQSFEKNKTFFPIFLFLKTARGAKQTGQEGERGREGEREIRQNAMNPLLIPKTKLR
jgi:hypothetical protein